MMGPLPLEILRKYASTSQGFRYEMRNLSRGWILDAKKAMERSNRMHRYSSSPIDNIIYTANNGLISSFKELEFEECSSWVYFDFRRGENIYYNARTDLDKYNYLDSAYCDPFIPIWIAGDFGQISNRCSFLLSEYYDCGADQIRINIEYNASSNNYIAKAFLNGEKILSCEGSISLLALINLYETSWFLSSKLRRPSISNVETAIDFKFIDGKWLLLVQSVDYLERKHYDNIIGYSEEYKSFDFYFGKYNFVEGQVEVFEVPLFYRSFIKTIDQLLQHMN